MGVWLGPMGGGQPITLADISYSGSMDFATDGTNWEAVLKSGTAATLRFLKNPGKVDIFIVAGGQTAPGYSGERNANSGPSIGDPGGAGGECITIEGLRLSKEQDYSVTVGGSDENSTITIGGTTYTARSGFGSRGGSGANYTPSKQEAPENGDDGVFAYGKSQDTVMVESFIGHKFGPGGGGGGAHLNATGAYSGAGLGGESNGAEHQYGKGGRYMVGYLAGANGSDGYDNHGQGGGGAAYYWLSSGGGASRLGDPGAGGSGAIFIRNHRG